MVGFTGAAFILAAGGLNNFIYEITGQNEALTRFAGVLVTIAGALALIAGIAAPVIGALSGNPVAFLASLSAGSTLMSIGAGGMLAGGTMMLSGPPKTGGTSGGGNGGYMERYDEYISSTGGFDINAGTSSSPSTLNVEQLNVNSDNLDEAFYSSQYAV